MSHAKYPPGTRRPLGLLASSVVMSLYGAPALANPSGPVVSHGKANFDGTSQPGTLNINNTPNAVINWQGFSVGKNEITRFIQQSAQSAVLNRVVGQDPSSLMGQLLSNGRVYLINGNGIIFGQSAVIDTAGFLASTLDISDSDFLKGNYVFTAKTPAGIENHGLIHTGADGNIILIAPRIENSGVLQSEGGKIVLAAGQALTLSSLDAPEVSFQIQAPSDSVLNLGQILANGGGAVGVFAGTLHNSGEISANAIHQDAQGNITLGAQEDLVLDAGSRVSADGPQGGNIHIESRNGQTLAEGSISAQGTQGKGGTVQLLGRQVGLLGQGRVDVSGQSGGGTALLGGDAHGANPAVANAQAAYMSPDAVVLADALKLGDGGKVVLWADDATRFYGSISAKGGTAGGNGGFVETSGHYLDAQGTVDASAPAGQGGSWLLDPDDLTIQAQGTDFGLNNSGPVWTTTGDSAVLTTASIERSLNAGTAVRVATGSAGTAGQNGDIDIIAPIFKSAGGDASLSLQAHRNIIVENGVSIGSNSGKLDVVLNADRLGLGAGNIQMYPGSSINSHGGDITFGGGLDPTRLPAVGTSDLPEESAGIMLRQAMLDAGGGNILLNGKGFGGLVYGGYGVDLDGSSLITQGSGNVTIQAAGSGSGGENAGLVMRGLNSRIQTENGAINLSGRGSAIDGSYNNYGIFLDGSSVLQTLGSGAINLNGVGGLLGETGNYGVFLNNATLLTGNGGDIAVTGSGHGTVNTNIGILIQDGSVLSSGGGLSLTGTGGEGGDINNGIALHGSRISTTGGNLVIRGTGGGTGDSNSGITADGTQISTLGLGNLSLFGTGGAGLNSNHGIDLQPGNTLSTVDGVLSLSGVGQGTQQFNLGIQISDSSLSSSGQGRLELTGLGGNGSDANTGISLNGGTYSTAGGNLTLNGTGQGSGIMNAGIVINFASLSTAGGGELSLTGRGGQGSDDNAGVVLSSTTLSSIDGALKMTGTGSGTGKRNYGVVAAATRFSTQGRGALSLSGTGGAGLDDNVGVYLSTDTVLSTGSGDLTVVGVGQGSGSNGGTILQDAVLRSGTGNLAVSGTGGNGTSVNTGVLIYSSLARTSNALSTAGGNLTVTGTGNGTGYQNAGIYTYGSRNVSLSAGGTGSLTLIGRGSSVGAEGHNNGIWFDAPRTLLSTAGGDLSLTGSAPSASEGDFGIYAARTTLAAGAGALTLAGNSGGGLGLYFSESSLIGNAGQSGPISLSAGNSTGSDSIFLDSSTVLRGSGELFLQPLNSADSIGLADGAGSFNLDATELATIQDGFSRLNIGRSDGTGGINFGGSGFAFQDNLRLDAGSGNISIDGPLSLAGNSLTLSSLGTVSQTAPLNAQQLNLDGGSTGNFRLLNGQNSVATLNAAGNTVNFADSSALEVLGVTANTSASLTSAANLLLSGSVNTGRATLAAGGDLTLSGKTAVNVSATGNAAVLSAGGRLLNRAGAGAILAPNGRWLAYLSSPDAGHQFGGLDSGNTAVWNSPYANTPPTAISQSGNRYVFAYQPTLTFTTSDLSKTYGDAAGSLVAQAYQVSGLQSGVAGAYLGDTLAEAYSGNAVAVSQGAASLANVAGSPYAITMDLSGAKALNGYALAAADSGQLTVTPYVVDLAGSRSYDGSTSLEAAIFQIGPLVGKQTLSLVGSGSMADKNIGTGKTVSLGSLALADGSNGGLAGNYTLLGGRWSVDITPADLLLSSSDVSKVYDGTTAAQGQAVVVAGGSLFTGDKLLGGVFSFTDKNAGTGKTVNLDGVQVVDGNGGANYHVSYLANTSSVITPAGLRLAGLSASGKVYDGTTQAVLNGGELAGVITGDTVALSNLAGSYADKNVGTGKTVTASASLSGLDAGNYFLMPPALLKADITPASLSLSGLNASGKVYDGTTQAVLNGGELSGVIPGDAVVLAKLSGSYADKNVGSGKTVTASASLSGLDAGNYFLMPPALLKADITPASLSLAGLSASGKVYDGTTQAVLNGGELSGVIPGDAVVLAKLSGSYADKNVGSGKTVTASASLSGLDAGNYFLMPPALLKADITPASLSLAGLSASGKVYDGTTQAVLNGGELAGVIPGDAVVLANLSGSYADKNVGTGKTVTASASLSGLDSGNYFLMPPALLKADITPASLSLAGLSASSKVYDGTTQAVLNGGELSGVIPGDAVVLASLAGSFADKNAGNAKPVAVNASLDGADAGNYLLAPPAALAADITPYVVNLSGVRASDGTLVVTSSYFSLGKLVGNETLTLSGSGSIADPAAGVAKPVELGTLALGDGSEGGLAGNYTLAGGVHTADILPFNTWTNASGGAWNNPANWDAGLPTAGSSVLIPAFASPITISYNLDGLALDSLKTHESLSLQGGLSVSSLALAAGTTELLSGSSLSVSGSASIAAPATLAINGGSFLPSGTLDNAGTLSLQAGSLDLAGGSHSGTFALADGASLGFSGAAPQFSDSAAITGIGKVSFDVSGDLALPSLSASQSRVASTGNIQLQGPVSVSDSLALTAGGNVTQSAAAPISAQQLALNGANANYQLDSANNSVAKLSGDTGTVSLLDHSDSAPDGLTVAGLAGNGAIKLENYGPLQTTGAITSKNSDVTLATHSPVTLGGDVSAWGNVTLSAGDGSKAEDIVRVDGPYTVQAYNGNIALTAASFEGDDGALLASNGMVTLNGSSLQPPAPEPTHEDPEVQKIQFDQQGQVIVLAQQSPTAQTGMDSDWGNTGPGPQNGGTRDNGEAAGADRGGAGKSGKLSGLLTDRSAGRGSRSSNAAVCR